MRDDAPFPSHADQDSIWQRSPLGPLTTWPESLRAYFLTACDLPDPAAIFWGEDHILLRNSSWGEAQSIIREQGQPQRHVLSKSLREALQSATRSKVSQQHRNGDVFDELASGCRDVNNVTLSPLRAGGVLVHLVRPHQLDSGSNPNTDSDANEHPKESDRPNDNIPLNEHPFFRRFSELLPSGLAILDRNAKAVFVNQKFWDLTTLQDDEQFTSWPQSIHPDDYDRVMGAYHEAFSSQKELRIEFRARDDPQPWRLLLLTPLGDEQPYQLSTRDRGGFICSIIDISSEKHAELTERKAAQQAHERKEQQERFIDMISHEIRNPLSAVVHCAEDIGEAIGENGSATKDVDVGMIREALATINLCVKHQRNIVDDVLSFSKLDASLLSLRPAICEPSKALDTTLKMFQHEFRKQKLQFSFHVEPGYDAIPVGSVLADMPRIGQVLINLMTNAIKFTQRGNGEKLISCAVSARETRPESYPPDIVFFRSENLSKMDATNNRDWGEGDALYIMVAVKDSGIGISKSNQQRLFERFRQATPKTGVDYGGSGLGLNISRKICQLHGGEIGVSSVEGEGSTFGFFFKVRRFQDNENGEGTARQDIDTEARLRESVQDGIDQATTVPEIGTEPFEWTSTPSKERASFFDIPEVRGSFMSAKENGDSAVEQTQSGSANSTTSDFQNGGSDQVKPGGTAVSRPQHVLLVEDNKINQRLLSRKLEKKGFKVTTANDGQEAVSKVQDAHESHDDNRAFDTILMDKEMPILDGNSATREIREMELRGQLPRAPIIGVTANVRGEQQDEMITSGMDDVISKPYEIDEMVTKIRKLMKGQEDDKSAKS